MNKIDKIYNAIGVKILKLRKEKAISQEQLSSLSGVDRSHIGFIEQGRRKPTLGTLYKLTQVLNVELGEFFKGIK